MLGNPSIGEVPERTRLVAPVADRLRRIAATLGAACAALPEGLAACRRYEHLRAAGVQHDAAIRTALDVPHPPAARVNPESTGGCHA
jgi:hypothetical protein